VILRISLKSLSNHDTKVKIYMPSKSNNTTQNATPTPESTSNNSHNKDFPIVGIGASAGGLKAVEDFLSNIPDACGLAFVLIMHLSPDHKSNLAEIVQHKTSMNTTQVMKNVDVLPNNIYIIPPNKILSLKNGKLISSKSIREYGHQSTIDFFLESLAVDQKSNAIGIILSGTGTDGTKGLRKIKELNGLTMVQDPEDAEYEGMPQSAISTGIIDYVLPAPQLATQLVTFNQQGLKISLPLEQEQMPADETKILHDLFSIIYKVTGHNFSHYKRSTVLRRITRRMQMNQIDSLQQYLGLLKNRKAEVNALFSDLLIRVTNFFRDPEAFQELNKEIIPQLFANRNGNELIRVWVAGCATGEEAYSIAILLDEYRSTLNNAPDFQIFASDIDENAINLARSGLYPESITSDISAKHLKRYFTQETNGYRIKTDLRERVLFAVHNLLKDPPFSNLDLISCRNLLIYLDRKMQELVFNLFHFAINPDGYLFLGLSETSDVANNLFQAINKKLSLYQRNSINLRFTKFTKLSFNDTSNSKPGIPGFNKSKGINVKELHQKDLIRQYAPPSIIVYEDFEIVHLINNAGHFLRFKEGEPTNNIIELVDNTLRLDLRRALYQVFKEETDRVEKNVSLKVNGDYKVYNIIIQPFPQSKGYARIDFVEIKDIETPPKKETKLDGKGYEPVIEQLEEELERTKQQLQITIRDYETSNEELRASNEEFQSMNEELQSSTEELETSKEELQSMNEELTTVNQELKSKIEELSRVNSDLLNLMDATDIGTIFLDRNYRVKRFTPRATDMYHLIPSDIGREIEQIKNKIKYDNLDKEIRNVLSELKIIEHEVQSVNGQWYMMRMRPYRTIDDRIDGVVISFIDITERKKAELKLDKINSLLEKRIKERTHELVESNKRLKKNIAEEEQLKREILNLSEQERWNIGQNLHDELGQMLTGTRLIGENLALKLKEEDPELAKTAVEIVDLIKKSDEYVRYMTEGILPVELESNGLSVALKKLIEHTKSHHNLDCELVMSKNILINDNTISTNLFRIAQEAVHNTVKHAEAKHLKVHLKKHNHQYSLIITDDGIGFSPKENKKNPSGMGSKIIQYRAQMIGAKLKVQSKPKHGTTVTCTIKEPNME